MTRLIAIAANNGSIGGGEVMLLNIAEALLNLGKQVVILAPQEPSELAVRAAAMGFQVVKLPAKTRLTWLIALRRWKRKNRDVFLWNNGLLPAFATSLMKNRVVHLHQVPVKFLSVVSFVARLGVRHTIVPSQFMATKIPGSLVLENWVRGLEFDSNQRTTSSKIRVGFIGRFTVDKGIVVLADAVRQLEARHPGKYELVVAGAARFSTKFDRNNVSEALNRVSTNLRMLGWVTPGEFFRQVDVFVCPSVWEEPFGLVLAECMSSRVPFITSTAGALPEVAGKNYAYQVTPGDSLALADCIETLVFEREKNPEAFVKLVASNYHRWQNYFSPEAGKERLSEVCKSMSI